jgi:hypothetical protein
MNELAEKLSKSVNIWHLGCLIMAQLQLSYLSEFLISFLGIDKFL